MSVSQASETTVSVEPNEISANVGEKVKVNCTIRSVQNLYGIGLTVRWNTSILELEIFDIRFGESDGVLFNPIYIAENLTFDGSYYLSAASTNPASSFNGSGNIAKLTFRVLALGETKIELQTQLYDYPPPDRDPRVSLPIAHTTIDGIFSGIVPEFPNVVVFLVFFTFVFLWAFLAKKTSRTRTSKNLIVNSCTITLKSPISQSCRCRDGKVGGHVGRLV
jgi:hypothetical protein